MNLVYKYESPSGKIYIGKTTESREERRKKEHVYSAKQGSTTAFHSAIVKYGESSFDYSVIVKGVDDSLVDFLETSGIYFYDSYSKGYNMTTGGDGVNSETASKNMKSRWKNKESSEALKKAMKGSKKTLSPEFIRAQSLRTKGKPNKWNTIEYVCPYCGKEGKGPNMKRYHFDNCKSKGK